MWPIFLVVGRYSSSRIYMGKKVIYTTMKQISSAMSTCLVANSQNRLSNEFNADLQPDNHGGLAALSSNSS